MPIPSSLSDADLVDEVARLAGSERDATASLIAHLAELYARRLHERAGYSSLFTYGMDVLRLSEHEAYDRMRAAKVVRRYPAVLELLASGRLNLTTVRLLAPHLTRRNHQELLRAACGKRKRQVQEMLAARFPQPDVPASIRRLPAPTPVVSVPLERPLNVEDTSDSAPAAVIPRTAATVGAPLPALIQPLSPDRYRITFTASRETCDMLEVARDLLRHAIPGGDPAQIVARALDVLVDDLVRKKFAATDRPRADRRPREDSRNIPAEVKRAVYIRDRGCCAFVGPEGRRCGERAFLEFHHLVPYAAGGRATVENIALRCRAHNGYEAEQFYGPIRDARVSADAFRSGTKAYTMATPSCPGPTTGAPGERPVQRGGDPGAWTPSSARPRGV